MSARLSVILGLSLMKSNATQKLILDYFLVR